ncbi:hypothetical protein ASA1KI_03040 [Opitutales bacterium ASA1]|uniref:hypothetical protein n=1 Tax=Congregicoccus parvus TaxID=3081749 RepID=UPI002B30D20E|nr:hypothetical protein ASA1KI_03040 [Opitutales bacterium ASA1]
MNLWIQKLRAGFLARARREKILTVLFLVVLVLIWASTYLTRYKAFSLALAAERATAGAQAQWLDDQESIEGDYAAAITRLSDAALPTRSEVQAQIDALLSKHAIARYRIDPPQTQTSDRLVFHTFSVSMERAEYSQLQAFQNELAATLPTVNLEQITLQSERSNPAQLNTRLRLVAVELNK